MASAPKTPEPGGAGNRATDGRQPETARAWAGGVSRASRKWWRWGSTPRPLSGLGSGRGGGPLRRGSCTPTSSLGAAERVLGRPRRPPLLSRPVGPGACGAALLCARWGTGPPAPLRLGLLCVTGVGVGGAAHFARPLWENQGARSLGNGVLTTTVCSVHERHSRHTRASTCTHMHTHVRAHTCIYTRASTCTHMHMHAHMCEHTSMHTRAHACTHVRAHVHTHVCVHARTRTHVAEAATVRLSVLHHVKRSWGTLQLLRAR